MKKSSARSAPGTEQTARSRGGRLSRNAPSLIGIFVVLGALAIGSASASAAPPPFDGLMDFPAIHGLSDPEEYSWEVTLLAGQSLKSDDSQYAEVDFKDGTEAMLIHARPAHDALGTPVPTSLGVSEGNVITLVVHHRAGNPTAAGTPFTYPIVEGQGWEGGYFTEIVKGPPDEQELREERERIMREASTALPGAGAAAVSATCLVPRLKGRSLKAAKKRLEEAGCGIGTVRKHRGGTAETGKVVRQSPKPGGVLAPGTGVDVTLGE